MTTRFCRAVGQEVHDINGRPIIFKGVGIGGWLLIEGYMIKSHGEIDRPWKFENHIAKMVDRVYAESFMKTWRDSFFTEKDVKLIARSGFNMIRIALDYAVFFEPSETDANLQIKEANFKLLDAIIQTCANHQVYVMLDLHAAPGGQTGANIDNSLNDHPDLFTKTIYQDQTVFIWTTIAKRYKDEPYIAAYDLLNEPLPEWFAQYNDQLMPLYHRIIKEIRQVDANHMITLEGLHWSTDWSCFKHLTDDNILLQFHKYWNNPDQESIQKYLDDRERHNLPIMMGEGGENNLSWFSTAFKLYEQKAISYGFWTYKKMSTYNALVSFDEPNRWDEFLRGDLTQVESKEVLEHLLDLITYDRHRENTAVANAIMNKNTFVCPGHGYDFYGMGKSFFHVEHHPSSFRQNDGMHIVNSEGLVIKPEFAHNKGQKTSDKDKLFVRLYPNEWLEYTFHIDEGCDQVLIMIQTIDGFKANVYVNGQLFPHQHSRVLFHAPSDKNVLRIQAIDRIIIESICFEATFKTTQKPNHNLTSTNDI